MWHHSPATTPRWFDAFDFIKIIAINVTILQYECLQIEFSLVTQHKVGVVPGKW